MSNPDGRPLQFENTESLQESIDLYFDECCVLGTPLTITGLCLALDCTIQTLLNYGARDEFFDTVKRAKLRIANSYEVRLASSDRPVREIFPLKAMGMPDKQQHEHSNPDGGPLTFKVTLTDD